MATVYDIAIIGSGPGGYVAAIRAAQLGLQAVVVEKAELGGVCLNWGCIPSKALIHQASLFARIPELEAMGLAVDKSAFRYDAVFAKSREAAERLSKGVAFLLKKNGVAVVHGEASFLDRNTLAVAGGDPLSAKHVLIASGAVPRTIPGFEIDEKTILSSNGALALQEVPGRVVVLGGGAIGLEFAYLLSCFGASVTVVEMLDRILPGADPDVLEPLVRAFRRRGVTILTGAKALGHERKDGALAVRIERRGEESLLPADKVLVAVGRRPFTDGLGLEKIGVRLERGFIATGEYYRTDCENVHAIGDVIDTPQLAHVASREGEIAVEAIAGHPVEARINPLDIPYGVYCEPQVAGFGMSGPAAEAAGLPYKTASFPYRGIGKAVVTGESEGLVKIVFHRETKEILGAHLVGAEATELVHELLLARHGELLPEDLAAMIHAHPTLSEAVMEAARAVDGRAVHA
jgi:dihydrolipoamide dehydrogenase